MLIMILMTMKRRSKMTDIGCEANARGASVIQWRPRCVDSRTVHPHILYTRDQFYSIIVSSRTLAILSILSTNSQNSHWISLSSSRVSLVCYLTHCDQISICPRFYAVLEYCCVKQKRPYIAYIQFFNYIQTGQFHIIRNSQQAKNTPISQMRTPRLTCTALTLV